MRRCGRRVGRRPLRGLCPQPVCDRRHPRRRTGQHPLPALALHFQPPERGASRVFRPGCPPGRCPARPRAGCAGHSRRRLPEALSGADRAAHRPAVQPGAGKRTAGPAGIPVQRPACQHRAGRGPGYFPLRPAQADGSSGCLRQRVPAAGRRLFPAGHPHGAAPETGLLALHRRLFPHPAVHLHRPHRGCSAVPPQPFVLSGTAHGALHGRASGRLRPNPDQHHLQRRRALLSPAAQHRHRAADPCRLEPGLQRLAERTVRRAAVPSQRLDPLQCQRPMQCPRRGKPLQGPVPPGQRHCRAAQAAPLRCRCAPRPEPCAGHPRRYPGVQGVRQFRTGQRRGSLPVVQSVCQPVGTDPEPVDLSGPQHAPPRCLCAAGHPGQQTVPFVLERLRPLRRRRALLHQEPAGADAQPVRQPVRRRLCRQQQHRGSCRPVGGHPPRRHLPHGRGQSGAGLYCRL